MKFVPLTHKLGYVIDDVPSTILETLVNESNSARNQVDWAEHLVGQMEEEWLVPFSDRLVPFVEYLNSMALLYDESTGVEPAPPGYRKLYPHIETWTNHMEKHQYQPPHSHGGHYSFVVWLKVPYKIEDELGRKQSRATFKSSGCFLFIHPIPFTPHMETVTLPVDNSYEGKIVLFPSSLYHMVCPFYTSDEQRVSLAGNLASPHLIPEHAVR